MADYIFTRAKQNGKWTINNIDRRDGEGNQIFLAKEVESALPGLKFVLRCNATEAKFIFEKELTASQQTLLETTVANHVQNK